MPAASQPTPLIVRQHAEESAHLRQLQGQRLDIELGGLEFLVICAEDARKSEFTEVNFSDAWAEGWA